MAKQSAQTLQRSESALRRCFQKKQKGRRQLRAGPFSVLGESGKSADKANSLHSLAAAPHPRPGGPTLSHHSLPTKDTVPRTFRKRMPAWLEGLKPGRTLGRLRWVLLQPRLFTQTRGAVHHPPKNAFHMYRCFYQQAAHLLSNSGS